MESILLRGEGGKSSLTVGNRKAGSSDVPLLLEMNESEYKLCSGMKKLTVKVNLFFAIINRLSYFRWSKWKSDITESGYTS